MILTYKTPECVDVEEGNLPSDLECCYVDHESDGWGSGIFGFRRSAGAQTARLAASSTCSNSKLVST
jgi:hypothetical protein